MTPSSKYANAKAFRMALETRLKQIAKNEEIDLQRLRRMVAFDRLLARLVQDDQSKWVLKGGYAMELRIKGARTTKDIDLTIKEAIHLFKSDRLLNDKLRDELQDYAGKDLGDYFVFLIGLPMMDIDAAPYGGARFPVDARLDGRTFVKFHVDIGIGDVVLEPLDSIVARDWLAFADITPPIIPALSKEQQFSEKLHAYTLPSRGVPNSRVKDLVDMALLIKKCELVPQKVKHSLATTFARRKTHDIPEKLEPPPNQWQLVFEKLAQDSNITEDIGKAFNLLNDFFIDLKN